MPSPCRPAVNITSAPAPLAADQSRRTHRYLMQMGIRAVCFLVVVMLWSRLPVWASVLLLTAAVVLPYIAVLFANAGRERRDVDPIPVALMLTSGNTPLTDPDHVNPVQPAPTSADTSEREAP